MNEDMILSRYATAKKRIEYLENVRSLDLRDTARTIEMSLTDIPILINALESEKKNCPNGGNDGYITPRDCQCYLATTADDRNKWKARAEVLERAVNIAKSCKTCSTNTNKNDFDKLFIEPCVSCNKVIKQNWKFDEARFTKQDGNQE